MNPRKFSASLKKAAKKRMDSFYPNACYVCKAYGKNVELQRCTKCGLIAYCGEAHRKLHWTRHKNFCRAVCSIVQDFGTMAEFAAKYHPNTDTSVQKTAEKFPRMVGKKLGRELTHNESLMLLSSRSCDVCFENDPKKLKDCPDCPSATFCLEHLQNKSAHAAKCSVTKFRFDLDRITGDIAPWTTLDHKNHNYGEKMPANMDDAIEIYAADYKTTEALLPRKNWETLLSEKLTNPYTFLHVMELLSVTNMTNMTIHIVDIAGIDISTDYWQSLLHHVASLQELHITLIGLTLKNEFRMLKCCTACQEKKRFVSLQSVGANYTTFAAGEFFAKPDCVMGFNIGIESWLSLQSDTWTPAIEMVAQLGCPFFVTSFTVEQSGLDRERINSILEKRIECHYTGPNPFSGLKPYEGSTPSAEFFFANQFLTIYKKLS